MSSNASSIGEITKELDRVNNRISIAELRYLRNELRRVNSKLDETKTDLRFSTVINDKLNRTVTQLKQDMGVVQSDLYTLNMKRRSVLEYVQCLEKVEGGPSSVSTTFLVKNLS